MPVDTGIKTLLVEKLEDNNETLGDIIECTSTEEQLSKQVVTWRENVTPFVAWTAKSVYFSVDYDGSVSVARVPRNPGEVLVDHIKVVY